MPVLAVAASKSMLPIHLVPLLSGYRMRESLYKEIVYLLHRHRTWLEVVSSTQVRKHSVIRNGKLTDITCRVLVVKAIYTHFPYRRGAIWQIAEYELDKAIKQVRIEKGLPKRTEEGKLPLQYIERIITMASHGILIPNLSELPIFTSYTIDD